MGGAGVADPGVNCRVGVCDISTDDARLAKAHLFPMWGGIWLPSVTLHGSWGWKEKVGFEGWGRKRVSCMSAAWPDLE